MVIDGEPLTPVGVATVQKPTTGLKHTVGEGVGMSEGVATVQKPTTGLKHEILEFTEASDEVATVQKPTTGLKQLVGVVEGHEIIGCNGSETHDGIETILRTWSGRTQGTLQRFRNPRRD